MKGYYTKELLSEEIYQSLIFSFMDKLVDEEDAIYDQFIYKFNDDGEFIYRAIHNKRWGFDKYSQIEMIVNDEGVFVDEIKNDSFTNSWIYALTQYRNNCENRESVL